MGKILLGYRGIFRWPQVTTRPDWMEGWVAPSRAWLIHTQYCHWWLTLHMGYTAAKFAPLDFTFDFPKQRDLFFFFSFLRTVQNYVHVARVLIYAQVKHIFIVCVYRFRQQHHCSEIFWWRGWMRGSYTGRAGYLLCHPAGLSVWGHAYSGYAVSL